MFRFAVACLLLITTMGSAYVPIKDSELPAFVPTDHQVRLDMCTIFNAARELAEIKRMGYSIVAGRIDNGWVYVTIERATLKSEVMVGRFASIKDLTIKDGALSVTYSSEKSIGWLELSIGVVVGVVGTCIVANAFK